MGEFKSADGDKYIGGYQENLKSGIGTFTWQNGNSYEGQWKEGYMHG